MSARCRNNAPIIVALPIAFLLPLQHTMISCSAPSWHLVVSSSNLCCHSGSFRHMWFLVGGAISASYCARDCAHGTVCRRYHGRGEAVVDTIRDSCWANSKEYQGAPGPGSTRARTINAATVYKAANTAVTVCARCDVVCVFVFVLCTVLGLHTTSTSIV